MENLRARQAHRPAEAMLKTSRDFGEMNQAKQSRLP